MNGAASLGRREIIAYGAFGLPLAFAALPLYVHVPRLYAGELGLPLATVGAVLLAARIVDAITDPLIGWAADRIAGRRGLVLVAALLLGLSLPALIAPPDGAGVAWLFGWLVVVSLAYSVASIAYAAWGAEVAPTAELRTRVVASREGFGLAGVMLAAALPGVLAGEAGEAAGLARLIWVFVPLLLACAAWTLLAAPLAPPRPAEPLPLLRGLADALRDAGFSRLLAVFAVNGIAAAVPSATVLFYVADVLQADQRAAGAFLVLYFAAAAASLPLWVAVSRRIGKRRAWLAGMALAIVVFAWAGVLGSGDVFAYGLICVLSGVALGADLSLPPSLLADQLAHAGEGAPAGPRSGLRAGACFGWWSFVTKANLALAAGLALPLLTLFGYAPGARDAAALAGLAAVYAGLPVVLKLGAVALLWRWQREIEPTVQALPVAVLKEVRS